jgi:hypothetical protein
MTGRPPLPRLSLVGAPGMTGSQPLPAMMLASRSRRLAVVSRFPATPG